MTRTTRFALIVACVAFAVGAAKAQEPGYGGGGPTPGPTPSGGHTPPRHPPNTPKDPPTTPVPPPPICRYTAVMPPGPLVVDRRTASDDFCNASASGLLVVGEADVDWNSLSSSAASSVGWVFTHHAVHGLNPCAPVSFSDQGLIHARTETRLVGASGARGASAAAAISLHSSVMPVSLFIAAASANSDSGAPSTWTFAMPGVPSGSGTFAVTVANPPGVVTSSSERSHTSGGTKVTEVNHVYGASSADVSAGSAFFGGGKARIKFSSASYVTTSSCPVHGVTLPSSSFAGTWASSMTSF